MNLKRLLLGFLIAIVSLSAVGQQLNPAQWKYDVKPTSENEAELVFTVTLDENWHIYSQHTDEMGPIGLSFSFDKSSDYTLVGGVNEPKPHEEYDEMFKCTIRSFSGTVMFKQKIKINSAKDFTVKGIMSYQLCNDGSCIAPEDIDFAFNVKGVKAEAVASTEAVEEEATADSTTTVEPDTTATVEENTQVAQVEEPATESTTENEGRSIWFIFLTAFGMGFITLLTPCVFPMIPMTLNFFMKGGENKKKGMRQAWMFGFSIIFIYGVLGVILSLIFGPQVMYLIGTHWIPNLVFFIIFFVFALSFFGLFEITLPSWLINTSDE
ncbi:MAG: hypothetical protein IJ269_05095, partial [Bacteroidales bacterium]|nr:hypothetical protein [Bacteroidales bacterium]